MTDTSVLICGDLHIPYHDRRAFDLLGQVAEHAKPDRLIVNGDAVDLYSVSLHTNHNPSREALLVKEMEQCDDVFNELTQLPIKSRHLNGGNHEWRLDRHILQKAPALWGALKIEELLKLEQRGWTYLPYSEGASPAQRKYYRIGKLWIAHDMGSANELAHVRAAKTFGANIVIGHGHRVGYQIVGNLQGKPHFGAMVGHMMDGRYADYVTHAIPSCLWQQGFAFAYIDSKGFVDFYQIPIVNGRCRFDGKVFKA